MEYIISQILVAVSILMTIFVNFIKVERKTILVCQIIVNLLYGTHNLLLGATTGGLINFLAVILLIIYSQKGKIKWLSTIYTPVLFSVLFVATALISWQNIFSILPVAGSLIFAVAFWQDEEKQIKLLYVINTLLWFIYAVVSNSFVAAIGQALIGISLIVYLIFGTKYEKAVNHFNIWMKQKFAKGKKE